MQLLPTYGATCRWISSGMGSEKLWNYALGKIALENNIFVDFKFKGIFIPGDKGFWI